MTRALAAALVFLGASLLALSFLGEVDAAPAAVTIQSSTFTPPSVEVRVGETVTWTNRDAFPHTATADNGAWDTRDIQGNGEQGSVVMNVAGTYNYHCARHLSMTGVVTVLPEAANNPPTIAITSPSGGSTVSNVTTISGLVGDEDGDILLVQIRIDPPTSSWVNLNPVGNSWSYQWDTHLWANTPHAIEARVFDGKTNSPASFISLTVANSPEIALTSPASDTNATLGSTVTFSGTAWAAPGSRLTVETSLDGAPWSNATGTTSWRYVWNTTGVAPGMHIFQARASDGASTVLSAQRNINVVEPPPPAPNEPPSLDVLSPAEGATVGGIVNISGTVVDTDSTRVTVEVNIDRSGWRDVTGRAGAAWWYLWSPPGGAEGATLFEVRASDGEATTALDRSVILTATPGGLVLQTVGAAPREGSSVRVKVVRDDANATPYPGASVFIENATTMLYERTTNATGVAVFPSVPAGSYVARAFAPGAGGSFVIEVRPQYDITVEPASLDYGRIVPLRVRVAGATSVEGVVVQLKGVPLAGNISDPVRTARDGNATFNLQPLRGGDLAVWVAGNDTGHRVRVVPIVVPTWTPQEPRPNETVRIALALNDANRTPAANANVSVVAPGEPPRNLTADALGEVTLQAHAPGTLRITVRAQGARTTTFNIPVVVPPATPELRDLRTVPSPGQLRLSVSVRNVGEGEGTFVIDAIASSRTGGAFQETVRVGPLPPSEEMTATLVMAVGGGAYDVTASARNSTQSLRASVSVPEVELPPPVERVETEPIEPAGEEETPGLTPLGLLVSLAVVSLISRRARR